MSAITEKIMSAADQTAIVEAVAKAASDHVDGTEATEAVVKAAKDISANEHKLKLMVDSFNTAKYLAHHKTADEANRADSFELADYDDALVQLQAEDDNVKAAQATMPVLDYVVHSHHRKHIVSPQEIVKVASENAAKTLERVGTISHASIRKTAALVDTLRVKSDAQRKHGFESETTANRYITELAAHFKANPKGWSKFAEEAAVVHGEETALELLTKIARSDPGFRQIVGRHHVENVKVASVVDDSTVEHQMLQIVKEAQNTAVACYKAADALIDRYNELRSEVIGVSIKHPKTAAGMSLMNMTNMMKDLTDVPKAEVAASQPSLDADMDTALTGELQAAKTQLALRNLIDTDPVIGQHATDDTAGVAAAMDKLTASVPGIENNPALLQQALRQALEVGTPEPFQVSQLQSAATPTNEIP